MGRQIGFPTTDDQFIRQFQAQQALQGVPILLSVSFIAPLPPERDGVICVRRSKDETDFERLIVAAFEQLNGGSLLHSA
jgi:hypothetical protein